MLIFRKNHSFENAFFIIPEKDSEVKNVLYVHTSVNLLNSFIKEISDKGFGSSKENVKKIEGVIHNMIDFIQENDYGNDQDGLSSVDGDSLESPFNTITNDLITQVYNRRKNKQKTMRELKVIEACINILFLPFATKSFDFEKITMDDSITSVCILTYKLLSCIVSDFRLNERYASQWIGLFLEQVLMTHN